MEAQSTLAELLKDPGSSAPAIITPSEGVVVNYNRAKAFITSANFTEAAWLRNIEVGVLLKRDSLVSRLSNYIEGLMTGQLLVRCHF
jgi:phosphatidylserine/phosphatidylglycerophosphate/cardiolipin synthase-like enzyme